MGVTGTRPVREAAHEVWPVVAVEFQGAANYPKVLTPDIL